jgi:hypothetical protein
MTAIKWVPGGKAAAGRQQRRAAAEGPGACHIGALRHSQLRPARAARFPDP